MILEINKNVLVEEAVYILEESVHKQQSNLDKRNPKNKNNRDNFASLLTGIRSAKRPNTSTYLEKPNNKTIAKTDMANKVLNKVINKETRKMVKDGGVDSKLLPNSGVYKNK